MVKKFILAVQTVIQADRISEENSNRRRSTKEELRRSSALSLVTGADTSLGITSNQCEGVLRVLSQPQSERNEPELTTLVPWLKSRSEIFNKCDRAVVLDILQNCTVEFYRPNDVIIKSGEKGNCFYVILDGSVTVWINGNDDAPTSQAEHGHRSTEKCDGFGTKVSRLGVGKGFGEVALISKDNTRTASIICDEPAQLLTINRVLYNRSIKSWQARELYEKYHFLHNSVFFKHLPAKQKHQVSHSLKKQTLKFGNLIMKQSEPNTDIHFIISGQVRVTCLPHKLQKSLLRHKPHLLTHEEVTQIRESISCCESPACTSRDICLLSAYDVIGSMEAALDLPVSAHTVAVEEEVVCFTMSRFSFKRLIRDRSYKTVAGFLALAMMQTEGRLARYPTEYLQFKPLLTVITRTYKDLCKNDSNTMRTIEAALYAHATRGAGYGNTLYSDNTPVKDKTEYHLPKIRVKPVDDFTNEGVDFLTSLRNGFTSPWITEAKMLSAKRYAMMASIKSENKPTRGYIQALLRNDNTKDRITAWSFDDFDDSSTESDLISQISASKPDVFPNGKKPTRYRLMPPLPMDISIVKPKSLPKLAALLPGQKIEPGEEMPNLTVHGAPLSITGSQLS